MTTTHSSQWFNRGLTFFLAAAAAASVVFWVLKWPAPLAVTQGLVAVAVPDAIDTRKLAQLLGNRATSAPDAAANSTVTNTPFKLLGVIATGRHKGSALMATDTAPAKPYRVGERVSDKLVLQSVSARSVVLAESTDAPGGITLTLPLLSAPH